MSSLFKSKQITIPLFLLFFSARVVGDFYFHPLSQSNPATLRIGKICKKRITCENVQDCVSRTPLQDQESELQDRYVSPFLYDFTPIYSQKILEHPPSPPFCRLLLVYHASDTPPALCLKDTRGIFHPKIKRHQPTIKQALKAKGMFIFADAFRHLKGFYSGRFRLQFFCIIFATSTKRVSNLVFLTSWFVFIFIGLKEVFICCSANAISLFVFIMDLLNNARERKKKKHSKVNFQQMYFLNENR